jgi:hypothetical protein
MGPNIVTDEVRVLISAKYIGGKEGFDYVDEEGDGYGDGYGYGHSVSYEALE